MTRTTKTRNRSFTSARGNQAVVWNEREVETRADGWSGMSRVVATWVEVAGHRVDVDAGRGHQAEAAVAAAGH